MVEEDLESPNSGLSHFSSALVSRCRELSRLPIKMIIVKTEDCIDKKSVQKEAWFLRPSLATVPSNDVPKYFKLVAEFIALKIHPHWLKFHLIGRLGWIMRPVAPLVRTRTLTKQVESLPLPHHHLVSVHCTAEGLQLVSRFLTSGPELAMICTECTEGMKAKKRKRSWTMTTLAAEFFSGIAVSFHRRS